MYLMLYSTKVCDKDTGSTSNDVVLMFPWLTLYKFSTIFNTLVKVLSLTTNNIYFLGSFLFHHCGGLGFPLPEYFEFIFPSLIYILFCRFFMLFMFLKLYKWYLIVQNISCASLTGYNSRLGSMRRGVPLWLVFDPSLLYLFYYCCHYFIFLIN